MGELPQNGCMAAVFAEARMVADALDPLRDSVSIAAVNGPENTVVSGEKTAVRSVLNELSRLGIPHKELTVSHAFHSPLMNPILDGFESAASRFKFSTPRTCFISNLRGGILDPDQVPDAVYWRRHVRETVNFSQAMGSLANLGIDVFLEVGPNPVLLGMGRRCLPEYDAAWLPSLRQGQNDWQIVLDSLGKLYTLGAEVDWPGFDRGYSRQKVALPNYPFDQKRYWFEPKVGKTRSSQRRTRTVSTPDTPQVQPAVQPDKSTIEVDRSDYQEQEVTRTRVVEPDRTTLINTPPEDRQKILAEFLQLRTASVLGMVPARLELDQPLDTLGLDSLMAMELKNALEEELGLNLPVANFLQGPTIASLAAEAVDMFELPVPPDDVPFIVSDVPVEKSGLSYGQQALWFLHQLLPEEISFNVAGAIRIFGPLNVSALERAFHTMLAQEFDPGALAGRGGHARDGLQRGPASQGPDQTAAHQIGPASHGQSFGNKIQI